MKCQEFWSAMNEYLDGETQSALCEGFRGHLTDCHFCRLVIDNIRHTITLYRAGEHVALPAGLHERLRAILREQWTERKGNRK